MPDSATIMRVLQTLWVSDYAPRKILDRLIRTIDYSRRNPVCRRFPRQVHAEIVHGCNLKCIMCPVPRTADKVSLMAPETFSAVVEQLKGKIEVLVLHSDGEPLLSPHVTDFVRLATRNNIKTMLSTNCTLLNARRSRELINAGLGHIVLAVDGVTKKTYEQIRVGASFERVMDNVHTFFRLKKQKRASNPFVTMQFVKMPENEHEANAFLSTWSAFDCVPLVKPATNLLSPNSEIIANHPYCHRLWHTLLVTPDGTILPCVANHFSCRFPLGKVLSEKIEIAWNSERLQFLRREIVRGRRHSPMCRNCNVTPIRPENRMELLRSVLFDSGSYLKIAAVLGYQRPAQTFTPSGREPPRHSVHSPSAG